MDNGITTPELEKVAEHFGYDSIANMYGLFCEPQKAYRSIALLPEILDFNKKFKVTIDYDPELSCGILQVNFY